MEFHSHIAEILQAKQEDFSLLGSTSPPTPTWIPGPPNLHRHLRDFPTILPLTVSSSMRILPKQRKKLLKKKLP